jgi:hypothetical protein
MMILTVSALLRTVNRAYMVPRLLPVTEHRPGRVDQADAQRGPNGPLPVFLSYMHGAA